MPIPKHISIKKSESILERALVWIKEFLSNSKSELFF